MKKQKIVCLLIFFKCLAKLSFDVDSTSAIDEHVSNNADKLKQEFKKELLWLYQICRKFAT